jgi:hypothetical protein
VIRYAELRALTFLRRAVKALESIAESQRTLAHFTEQQWIADHAPVQMRKAEFSHFNADEASERYLQSLRDRGVLP